MALISEGISKVRAFELPAGIWSDGKDVGVPRTVLVKWQSSWADKFYQVYVNGVYAGTSDDAEQKAMVVQLPTSFFSSVCIEVFAVDAAEADGNFGGELLDSKNKSGRVRISLLREQMLAAGAKIQIYFDSGTGVIDYDKAVNSEPIEVWPSREDKGGFGMSRFGLSDFGRDWSAGVGFGKGSFGYGWFGVDADFVDWISEQFGAGVYKFAAESIDEEGNESAAVESGEVVVLPAARGAEDLSVVSFDESANKLILGVK